MRVALVCGSYEPRYDGVADYVRRLGTALRDAGADPVVVAAAGAGGGDDPAALPLLPLAPRWDLRGTAEAARGLAQLRPDVVHVQFAPSAYGYSPSVGLLPPLLRAHARLPVVTTLHEYGWWSWPPSVPGPAWRLVERTGRWDRETLALVPGSDAVVSTNSAHAAVLRQRLRREPVVVPIGPNVDDAGDDPVRARREVGRRYGLPPEARLVVHFGFVHPVKGVRYLVEALPALRRRSGDVRLVVAGGFTSLALPQDEAAEFRRELERRAHAAGVAPYVTFTDHLPAREVSRLLRAADVVALPMTAGVTTKSGALVAALHHGAAVAATVPDEPDRELVDGETVVAIRTRRDAAAVVDAVGRLLDDDRLRASVARRGRRLARARSWDAAARAHLDVYTGVVR